MTYISLAQPSALGDYVEMQTFPRRIIGYDVISKWRLLCCASSKQPARPSQAYRAERKQCDPNPSMHRTPRRGAEKK